MAKKLNANTMTEKRKNIINAKTPFIISEAYNTARTNLIFSLAAGKNKTVVFTSCNPAEGKSISCMNMAITMAKAGQKVLIIDADLRKPTIHKLLQLNNKNGLSSILGNFCSFKESVHSEIYENLDIVTSGLIPPNPAELLSSETMIKLLEFCQEHYSYVFIDTPPVGLVSDSLVMNTFIAGIVFVVHTEKTTHPDIQSALQRIQLANGKVLGILKVNCHSGGATYGKSKNKYNYDYNNQNF